MQRHDEIKPNVFDEEKIQADTDDSRVFSCMLESESSSPLAYVEDSSHGTNGGHDSVQKFEDCDMGLEPFSTSESNNVPVLKNNEDSLTDSTEDGSFITTKSDTFSLLHGKNIMAESLSEDTKSVSRKDSEIDDSDRTTIGRETLFIDQNLEMYNTESKNEKDMECETKDRVVNLVEENGENTSENENIDSNANTWSEKCEEESLSLQIISDFVAAIVADKGQGTSSHGEESNLVGQSSIVSATEHENQINTAEEELVPVSGKNRPQTPPESGSAYDHMITRQELLSNGREAICEQSMLEQKQKQPCLPTLPLGENDNLEWNDPNGKQETHIETIELPLATNETYLVPDREGTEPGELPLATNEQWHTNEESDVMERTDSAARDAAREATHTGAGNGIQKYAETVESSFISDETNDIYKENSKNVLLPSQMDKTEGVSNEFSKAVEPLCAIGVTESLVMQTDSSNFERKSNVVDKEKIHAETDASCVLSSMLEAVSSSLSPDVEEPSRGTNRGHNPVQRFEVRDTGLELFSTPESNVVSIPTDNENFNAESTEDGSYTTPKNDTFPLLNKNIILTESPEDAKFVSGKDEEINDFDRTTIGRESPFIDQSLEMHNDGAKNEKGMECEATDQDVNLVGENGKHANEGEDINSNDNTQPKNCEEEPLGLQVNTDVISTIVIDKDQGNSNLGKENSPLGQSVTVSATEHKNQQSKTAEEELVLFLGQDCPQTPPESGASYANVLTRQQLPSNCPDVISEKSVLEQEQRFYPLPPFGEKDSREGSDQNEKQQTHIETVELSISTNETILVPDREGIEQAEFPLATDEKSCTKDSDQHEESDDAFREATQTAAGNVIQQYAETIMNETNNRPKDGSQNVILPCKIDKAKGVSSECFNAVEQLQYAETIINETNNRPKDVSQNVILPCKIDKAEGVSSECFNAVEQLCHNGLVADGPIYKHQPSEMIEESSAIGELPEAVRDFQGQITSIFLNGSGELQDSISLDETSVNKGSNGDSSPTIQEAAQVNGDGIEAGEPDSVNKTAVYPNDGDESSIREKELVAKAVSQTSDQEFGALTMDRGLTENILILRQGNEEKLQLQINEVMAKTASEMLPSRTLDEPLGAVTEEQNIRSTTEVPKNTSLTHRAHESQDLRTLEVDKKASIIVRETIVNIQTDKRASIWDCCGFWNWLHAHED